MADITVPYPEVGLAAFEDLDNYTANILLSGSDPKQEPGYPMPVTANLELQQFSVVGLVAGKLVMATDAIKPIGVLTQHVVGAADGETTVPVWFTGMYNPDALVWHDDFATDEDKRDAFVGSPSPTRIQIRKRN